MRWLVLALLLIATPAQAAVVWFSGMETHPPPNAAFAVGTSEFTQVDGGSNHDVICAGCARVGPVRTGCCALRLAGATTNSGFVIGKKGLNLTTAYTRLYINIATGTRTVAAAITDALNSAQTSNMFVLLLNTNGTLKWCFDATVVTCSAIATGSTVLVPGTWYRLDIKMVVAGSSTGGMEVLIDGATEFTSFGTTTNTKGNIDHVAYGPVISVSGGSTVVYAVDDMAVSDSAYLGAGGTLGRQGTSGSPTYTAWTKNSCAGSLIENCWSEAPFTAGVPNASSAVAADAQTMVVHDFATTQRDHGQDILTVSSTVNACKTAAIIKSGTSSAPVSIRRRINGSDTDTAKTLTTSDVYYDDGIWTTTVANLSDSTKLEIGILHGSGSATDTVEDMWLMCDMSDLSTVAVITPGLLWFSGVEMAGATSGGTAVQVGDITMVGLSTGPTSGTVHAGGYALTWGTNGSRYGLTPLGFNLSTAYVRMYYRTSASMPPAAKNPIFGSRSNAPSEQFSLYVDTTGVLTYSYAGGATLATGSTALVANTWYLIEAKLVIHASAGGMEVKVNSVPQFSDFTHDTTSLSTMDSFGFGAVPVAVGGTTLSGFMDDMAVSRTNYLGAGEVLARQGTTGSPTYNAWTKNSCGSSNIEDCWSETPFSATKNASSATPGDAQTMLVHSFGTTQTGHGTETVTDLQTINGCRMMAVAKATAASSMSLRWRVSSVDTDTTVLLTTGDLYYLGDIFGAVAVSTVNTSEIGAVENGSTQTVEDAWMMCDINLTPPVKHRVIQQ